MDIASSRTRNGYTLIELSMVIIIIGLIIGGVMAGQSMVRSSEINSVISDLDRYAGAANTFKGTYKAWPGDMVNATTYWGAAHATPATCISTTTTGTATCNGNGDGQIGPGNNSDCYERHRFWQQLANAGLIEGKYSGVPDSGGECYSTLTDPANAPKSKLQGGGYIVASGGYGVSGIAQISAHHSYFDGEYGQRLFFGSYDSTVGSLYGAILTSEEAWGIDTKMDDGAPAYGKIQTYKNGATWGTPNCATTDDSSTAAYALTTSGRICALMYRFAK